MMEHYRQEREQKDRFFKEHPQSPIPFEERIGFQGLDYYPPDIGSRFEIDLHEHNDKQVIQIEDTGGNMRDMIRWGEFRFRIGDVECTLQAYKAIPMRSDCLYRSRMQPAARRPMERGGTLIWIWVMRRPLRRHGILS